ncbi:glycosyltransferase [Clostridium sp.]|uniref:glycosyltransferase n=1 Tax=Clostridium sp. TaxID=1506 RepID=UPI0034644B6F
MKVLHITTNVFPQSACYRLHKSLLKEGVDSKILVVEEFFNLPKVIPYIDTFNKKLLWKIKKKIDDRVKSSFESTTIFSLGHRGMNIFKHPLVKEAEVIHLHWINDSFMSIHSLEKFKSMGKKVVWTCHDSWPFTGGCHVRYECKGYIEGCSNCHLVNNKGKKYARELFRIKEEIFKDYNIKLIAPSRWTKTSIEESKVFKGKQVFKIHNTLDLNTFKPEDKLRAKESFGIDKEDLVLTFGAVNSTTTKYKGYEYLLESLRMFLEDNKELKEKIHLLIFGSDNEKRVKKLGIKYTFTGFLKEELKLDMVYNASDLFLVPSLEDSLNYTVMEALSCEVPVIAFETGGIPDLVKHKENGYLAKFKDSYDFSRGIKWCIENNVDNALGKAGRIHVEKSCNMNLIAEKHIEVYLMASSCNTPSS